MKKKKIILNIFVYLFALISGYCSYLFYLSMYGENPSLKDCGLLKNDSIEEPLFAFLFFIPVILVIVRKWISFFYKLYYVTCIGLVILLIFEFIMMEIFCPGS